jgi:hypothetical protein
MIFMGGDPVEQACRMNREIASLRAAYQDFEIDRAKTPPNKPPRFEAVRVGGEGTLDVVITADAAELRQILDAALA